MGRGTSSAGILLTTSLLWACGGESATETVVEATISAAAKAYLNEVLDLMQTHSINRYTIDWPSFREVTFTVAGAAQTAAGTHNAIRSAVERLGDNHSSFFPDGGAGGDGELGDDPIARHLGNSLGYISVPAFVGSGSSLAASYHRLIEGIDAIGVCGWVVDVRSNTGGNMWLMVTGVGPILGEGVIGFFIDPDSNTA